MSNLVEQVGLGKVKLFLQKNLSISDKVLNGLVCDLFEAASHHSYVETFSQRADSWHKALSFTSENEWFNDFCEIVKKHLPRKLGGKIVLAIDITEEAYYGRPTIVTVPWTGENGITAWWEFIVVSLVNSSSGKTIPLAALPFKLGMNLTNAVEQLLNMAASMLPKIDLVLFDRGFYSGELINFLNDKKMTYLILVRKTDLVRGLADQCRCTGRWAVVHHTIEWFSDKSKQKADTQIVIFPDENYDWTWATNVVPHHISRLVWMYRIRWRIETMFRVQDTARVKTKSRRGIVRYVTFLTSLLLTAVWTLACVGKPFQRWLADTVKLVWLQKEFQKIIPNF